MARRRRGEHLHARCSRETRGTTAPASATADCVASCAFERRARAVAANLMRGTLKRVIISGNQRAPSWAMEWRVARVRGPWAQTASSDDYRHRARGPEGGCRPPQRSRHVPDEEAIMGHQRQSANVLMGTYRRSVDFEHPCDEPRVRQRGSPERMRRFGVQSGT